jgi:hypothetical protein
MNPCAPGKCSANDRLNAPALGEIASSSGLRAFTKRGKSVSLKIDGMLDQAVVGVDSLTAPGECVALDNTGHPVNKRLNLATAVRNVIDAFGITWRGEPDRNNGHFAPFAWQGEAA